MKSLLSLVSVLFIANISYCQTTLNDTIHLKELLLETKTSNLKLKKVKMSGNNRIMGNLYKATEYITLVEDAVPGTLYSLSFYFNSWPEARHPETSEIALVFYERNPDGTPGAEIATPPTSFTVNSDKKGKVTINVYPLSIAITEPIFVGIKKIMVRDAEGVFTIDSVLEPGKRTAFKKRYDGTWDNKVAPLRMEVKIATK